MNETKTKMDKRLEFESVKSIHASFVMRETAAFAHTKHRSIKR
jgi:hypothetical protein